MITTLLVQIDPTTIQTLTPLRLTDTAEIILYTAALYQPGKSTAPATASQ